MSRNLKALGLALVAALAMSAVAASGASADAFRSAVSPTYLTADTITPQAFHASLGDAKDVHCERIEVSGEVVGTITEEVTVGLGAEGFKECGVYENGIKLVGAKVTTNGCHYTFTGDTGGEEVHLAGCEEGKGITVDVSALNTTCIHIPEQTLGTVEYGTTETAGIKDVHIIANVAGIESLTTNHGICPTRSGEAEEVHTTGTYTGEIAVTGFSDAAHTTRSSIWVE